MYLAGFLSAAGRRAFLIVSFAAALCATPLVVLAQGAAAPAAPAQDAHAAFRFTEAGMIIWQVPEDRMAGFEATWSQILAKLASSPKPELKEMAASLKIFKPSGTMAGQPVSYFILADPASKAVPYSPVYLLYESGLFNVGDPKERAAVDAMFKTLPTDGNPPPISALPLKKVQSAAAASSAPAPAAAPAVTTP
jgi:hypothetical protein